MKKTKTIIIPAKPETTREVIVYGCDICDYESKNQQMFRTCCCCGRVVCHTLRKSCSIAEYDHSDYPDYYCFVCHNLKFDVYKEEAETIEKNYEKATDELEQKIIEESLAAKGWEKPARKKHGK